MSTKCLGITLSGKSCHRKITNGDFCFQHQQSRITYRQSKPTECIICCESLANQRRSLKCGHWIHKRCIIESAKAECPICRSPLDLGSRATAAIRKLAKKRAEEDMAEEEEELRNDLQNQVAGLIAPALQERIHEVVGSLLDETDDIDAADVMTDLFDDDTYQSFLHSLMGYDLIDSDIFSNDSDVED